MHVSSGDKQRVNIFLFVWEEPTVLFIKKIQGLRNHSWDMHFSYLTPEKWLAGKLQSVG